MDPMDTDGPTDPHEGSYVAPAAAHPAASVYDQSDAASMLTTPTLQIDVSFVLCYRDADAVVP